MLNTIATLRAEPAIANPPGRTRRDWVLAGAVAAGTVIEVATRPGFVWPALGLAYGLALAYLVLTRRTHPLQAVLFGFGGFAAVDTVTILADRETFVLGSGAVVLVFAYALFRWGSARHAATGLVAMAAAVVAGSIVDDGGIGDAVGGAAVVLLAAVLGTSIRYRRTVREQVIEQARSQVRQQIARELHDTVAHHVSAIAIQARAGLVEVDAHSMKSAAESLQNIADEASRALTEMRSMVGVLRDDAGGVALAQHRSVPALEQLTERSTASVTVNVQSAVAGTDIAPMLATTLYRVAQESVTNALRHARHAQRIDVRVNATPDEVELTISDDGSSPVSRRQAGYGLTGMSERVELLGGTFGAGPHPSGGWAVRAVLPR